MAVDLTTLSPARAFEQAVRVLLSLLILALLGAILAGVLRTLYDLRLILEGSLAVALKRVLVDAITVLAVVEVFRTALAYFAEGRVKVTYIIDTVLVTLLSEILAFWFKELEVKRVAMVIAIVISLGLLRVLAIHFSPNRAELSDGL